MLSDTQSTRQLCEYDNQVVLWKASDSPSQAQCQWRPSAALGASDYKNMRSGRHLFSELTKYQAGAVHLSDHCLCDNPREGLVIGPYCANEDCHWDPAPAECVFRSRLSQRCMSDLLVSMAPASKCLCEERGGLAIAYGPACAASTCQWHWNAGAFLNQASSRALAAHVAQQMDGSLLARERHCFCDVGGKLEFSSACDSANCQWTRGCEFFVVFVCLFVCFARFGQRARLQSIINSCFSLPPSQPHQTTKNKQRKRRPSCSTLPRRTSTSRSAPSCSA